MTRRRVDRVRLSDGKRAASVAPDVPDRLEHFQHFPLDRPKIGLALLGEDVGDRPALAALDEVVDVLRLPPQTPGQRARDRAFAASHEADEIDLVGHEIVSAARSASKFGYETATASAPVITVGPVDPSPTSVNAMTRR